MEKSLTHFSSGNTGGQMPLFLADGTETTLFTGDRLYFDTRTHHLFIERPMGPVIEPIFFSRQDQDRTRHLGSIVGQRIQGRAIRDLLVREIMPDSETIAILYRGNFPSIEPHVDIRRLLEILSHFAILDFVRIPTPDRFGTRSLECYECRIAN